MVEGKVEGAGCRALGYSELSNRARVRWRSYLRPVTRRIKANLTTRTIELDRQKLFMQSRRVARSTRRASGGRCQRDNTIVRVGSDREGRAPKETVDGRRVEHLVGAVGRGRRLPIRCGEGSARRSQL